jgi:hypothetical protein
VCLLTAARPLCSQSRNSSCRNLHCRPTLIAGISLHSARRQTARVDIPSHRATAAVLSSISGFDRNFSMKVGPCSSELADTGQRTHFPVRTVRCGSISFLPGMVHRKNDDALSSLEKIPRRCQEMVSLQTDCSRPSTTRRHKSCAGHIASQVPKAWDARRKARLVVPTFSSVSLAGTAMREHAALAARPCVLGRPRGALFLAPRPHQAKQGNSGWDGIKCASCN